MKEKIDDIIAFVFGDFFATILAIFHFNLFNFPMDFPLTELLYKVFLAGIVGVVGGGFGLFGKDIYIKYFRTGFMKKKIKEEEKKEE